MSAIESLEKPMISLENRLLDLVADVFGLEREALRPDMTATDIDGWDSLGHVTFLSLAEGTFAVTLPEDTKERIGSLPDLLTALRRHGAV